ncbi:hypothetical protein CsSME_00051475 [Camellia sinensis var. sinensis]
MTSLKAFFSEQALTLLCTKIPVQSLVSEKKFGWVLIGCVIL